MMKVLYSYLCRPSDVVSVFRADGILRFTMSGTARWKRFDWGAVGTAVFEQEADEFYGPTMGFRQQLLVDVEHGDFVDLLKEVSDICEVYAAHFTEDGLVFFQGFESVLSTDRFLTGSSRQSTRGRYSDESFTIEGRSRTLATVVEADNSAAQEQFLEKV